MTHEGWNEDELHDMAPRASRWSRLRGTPARRAGLSAMGIAALVATGVLGTQATFSDDVTMATVSVTGGTLDLTANGGDGPNEAWVGALSAAITGMQPGDEQSGTVEIANNGDLDFSLTAASSGVDASACFSYYFRETAATGATKAAAWPVNTAGFGSSSGADAGTVPFATAVSATTLLDVTTGSDSTWETDDSKTYTLTVRMLSTCATNAATGTLDIDLAATQV